MLLQDYIAVDTTSRTGLRWIKVRKGVRLGAEAFTAVDNHGYFCGTFAGKKYTAHRVVFFLLNGYWAEQVDHIDGVRKNNSPCNLRAANANTNQHNKVCKGYTKRGAKYQAVIMLNCVSHNLGYYNTPEEAHAAYLAAKATLHPTAPARCF